MAERPKQKQQLAVKVVKAIFNFYRTLLGMFVVYLWEPFLRPKRVKLPPIDNRLLLMPAFVLADEIRRQRLSSEEVVGAYLERIGNVNAGVNAAIDVRTSEALREAIAADNYVRDSGKSPQEIAEEKPLLGVPVTVKGNLSCKGMSLDVGLVSRRGVRATYDADVVIQLREAGAVVVAISNVPELCCSWNTHNKVHGQTWNPYDLARSSGGSSGGESALISSAASVLGVGNDLSGSLRIPACLTGIFAHKPTTGVISNQGLYPNVKGEINNILSNGPLCRYAEDMLPAMKIMANPLGPKIDWDAKVNMSDVKVFYCVDDIGYPFVTHVDEQVREAILKAVSHFQKKHGIIPKRVSIPKIRHASWILSSKLAGGQDRSFASVIADDPDKEIDVHSEMLKCLLGMSNYTLPTLWFALMEAISPKKSDKWYPVYRKIEDSVSKDLREMLDQDNAVLLFPSCPEPGVYPFEAVSKIHCLTYFAMFNVLGLPVSQSPLGFSRDGLPMGVQIVGALGKDPLTIAVAQELERTFGGWKSPCPLALIPLSEPPSEYDSD